MYNYNHLYYFYTTVKSEGVTSAAKHLHISQPSLSGQLRVLEDFLQIKLFTKVGRKNQLTPEGAMVYNYCRRMFELSEKMNEALEDQDLVDSKKIYVGITDEMASPFVVKSTSNFLHKYKEQERPRIVMVSGDHDELMDQLKFKELDVVVTSLTHHETDLVNMQSLEVPVHLFCHPADAAYIVDRNKDIKTLLDEINKSTEIGWILPQQGTILRTEINSFFESHEIQGQIVLESDIPECLTRSVRDNYGMALLPSIYAEKESKTKCLLRLGPEEGYWKHRIWVTAHIDKKDDELINSISLSFKDLCN